MIYYAIKFGGQSLNQTCLTHYVMFIVIQAFILLVLDARLSSITDLLVSLLHVPTSLVPSLNHTPLVTPASPLGLVSSEAPLKIILPLDSSDNDGVCIKYCLFSQEFSKVCHLSLASTRLLLIVQKKYQPLGVTVHSHCVESFEGLLQRCRRGRGYNITDA